MIIRTPLNVYTLKCVSPPQCIRHKLPYSFYTFKTYDICSRCEFCIGDECIYELYKDEISFGRILNDSDKRSSYYLQIVCSNCGKIVQVVDVSPYIYGYRELICKGCGRLHLIVERDLDGGKSLIAVPYQEDEQHEV